MTVRSAVLSRYSEGVKQKQAALCCPVDYDADLLKILPQEIIEKDYGCGDPSRYVQTGDIVLDLGSGSGKICYMAAQLVGEYGKVIGIDMNDDMLALARKYQEEMAEKLGGDRVKFVKGLIQDLALDIDAMENWLSDNPVNDANSMWQFEQWKKQQRESKPLIENNSVDLVISNCVLNLVDDEQKKQLVSEIYRVLKPGGRIAISDIVSDEPIPQHLKEDEKLWSGCISGAFEENEFLQVFAEMRFHAVNLDQWSSDPWQIVEGIEFRSVTVTATKGKGSECIDKGHAVIYRGPYSYIKDDDGHEYFRGERMAVCERTFNFLTEGPHHEDFIGIAPTKDQKSRPWCSPSGTRRSAIETKGGIHVNREDNRSCC